MKVINGNVIGYKSANTDDSSGVESFVLLDVFATVTAIIKSVDERSDPVNV